MKAERIFETSLYGEDLDALQEFYTRVLGLEVLQRFDESGVSLRCGAGVLILFDAEKTATLERGVPAHGAKGEGHIAFATPESELEAWRAHLELNGVPIETEVAWASGGRSIYFRDPAGNSVELAPPTLWGMPAR